MDLSHGSPLETDGDGVHRIAGTGVAFDAVLEALNKGHTFQEIAAQFPELGVADVQTVVNHFLRNGSG